MQFKRWLSETVTPIREKPPIVIGNVTLRLVKDTDWGEFIVRWIENRRVDDMKSYHTNDLQDAIQTMDDMARRLQAAQSPAL